MFYFRWRGDYLENMVPKITKGKYKKYVKKLFRGHVKCKKYSARPEELYYKNHLSASNLSEYRF